MENDLIHFLKTNKIFSSLDEITLKSLIPKLTRIELPQSEALFEQNDEPEHVYILLSGKLAAQLTIKKQIKTVAYFEKADLLGELAALSNEPYPYTVVALGQSVLYQLPAKEFIHLCHLNPSMMLAATYPLIVRSQNHIHSLSKEPTHKQIAILPINKNQDMARFLYELIPLIEAKKSFVLVSDLSSEYREHSAQAIKEKLQNIEHLKKSSQQIIYILTSTESPLAKFALKKADTLYLIANAETLPEIDPLVLATIQHNKALLKTAPHLVLLHNEFVKQPKHSALWLQLMAFNLHHHIRLGEKKHFSRLIRFMQEKAIGLVLSGGGTRGWAHLGAIKAIREQKIPIDFIGGTSVGAIIGGCYALNESFESAFAHFQKIISASRHSISARSFTLPHISIFDGKSFTDSLYAVFADTLIEDLWLPYFCISSNLANFNEEVHRTGLLWEKARASSSIPGLIPPTVIQGEIHFDGGLLNNLPVDVMWSFIGEKGKVIAIELTSSMHDYHKYHFPPYYTLKQALLNKIGVSREVYSFPRFIDSFIRGLLVGSSAKSKLNGHTATILVNLSLRKYRILQFNKKQAEKIFEIGYLETTSNIFQFKNRNL